MTRARLAAALGAILLAAACVLLCGPLGDWFAESLPYQDPTPDMLDQQAARIAAAKHNLITRAWISGGLATIGLAALAHSTRAWINQRRGTRPPADTPTAG